MGKSLLTRLGETFDQYNAERCTKQPTNKPSTGHLHRLLRWLTPNGGTLIVMLTLLLTVNVWAKPLMENATSPGPSATTVNYQGRLADDAGAPLDGAYGMTFALYDAPSGGNLVWGPENHAAVPVSDGLFSVGLGSQTAGGIPTSTWNGDRYLEITVGGETLSPRELIRSVPIAGMALTVPDGAIGTSHLSDHAITSAKRTIATYHAEDNAYAELNGKTTVIVSEFKFTNVPSGDVFIEVTLVGNIVDGASDTGTLALLTSSSEEQLDRIPTHIFSAHRGQVVLHGQIPEFSGGTLVISLIANGERDATQLRFGVANNDGRFGRRITVIAGL